MGGQMIETGVNTVEAELLNESGPYESKNGSGNGYEAHYLLCGQKVWVEIHADFYDFQSYARAHVYDPAKRTWNALASIPYSQMKSKRQIVPYAKYTLAGYEEDVTALLKKAAVILG